MLKNERRSSGILIILGCCLALCDFEAKAAPVIPEATKNIKVETKLVHFQPPSETSSYLQPVNQTIVSTCGVEDDAETGRDGRTKRYVLRSMKWPRNDLTYGVAKYTKSLKRAVVDDVLEEAFAIWAEHADLKFTRTSSKMAIIEISFVTGEHGGDDAFDGPPRPGVNNVLAHGFYPSLIPSGGDIHFDDDEHWTLGNSVNRDRVDLLQVAVHEIGHALGLRHSEAAGSIMNKHYNRTMTLVKLADDDIAGVQKLYGKKRKHSKKVLQVTQTEKIVYKNK